MTVRRVLVTGAAGRLGSTVASLVHRTGHELLATDVVDAGETPYPFRPADLLDHEVAAELLEGIDVVMHIGNHPGIGPRPPQQVFNENVTINENVFQGAAERGVGTIVFASTVQLIGSHPDVRTVVDPPGRPTFPIDGTTEPRPSNVYSLSKTVSETMLRYYAERCGIAATALRLPLLHHDEDWVEVGEGDETPVDVFEGFTGLTYGEAAALFLAVVQAELSGYHVFMAGTAHRHRDLSLSEVIERFYPDLDRELPDLIDNQPVTLATGWRPGRPPRTTGSSP